MYFGVQYYRPPFPGREVWRRDIAHIKSLGFNTVKLWAVWNWIERKRGVYDFSELEELVAICAENGLDVILNTIPEGAPYWTSQMEGSFYKTSKGEYLNYSGPANIPSAGWPGLCPDSEEGLTLICNFIEQTALHFAKTPAVKIIDVWNEPHLEPMFDYTGQLLCYCEHSVRKFREWLKQRYGMLGALNRAWFRAYSEWEQIEPPCRFGTAADMIDWRRFWLYNLRDWLRARVQAAKRGAPDKLTQTHTAFSGYMGANNQGGLGNELGDEFLLACEVDAFGLSSFPLWLMGERHVEGHFLNAEIIAEAAKDKPFYQVELQGGAGKPGILGHKVPSETDVCQWNWSIVAAGGKGVVYWQYSPEPAGMESPGFGLVNANGGDTPRSLSASALAKFFLKHSLTETRRASCVNAIYLSRNSDLFAYAMGDEEAYNRAFAGIYRVLYECGIPVRFVHADYAAALWEQGVRALYVPMALCLDEDERTHLTTFAKLGGKLIVEGCAGLYRENGEIDMEAVFLRELFGMEGVHIEPIPKTKILTTDGTDYSCTLYRQMFEKRGEQCEASAHFADGHEAALRATYGKGEAIWISGFAGISYHLAPDDGTKQFIAGLFDPNGYANVELLESNGMTVRILEDDKQDYVVCVNRSGTPLSLRIRMREMKELSAVIPVMDGKLFALPKT